MFSLSGPFALASLPGHFLDAGGSRGRVTSFAVSLRTEGDRLVAFRAWLRRRNWLSSVLRC